MGKERKIKLIAISALIVAILGLTVAFASLSQTLTINGAATLDAAKWGIKFENLSSGKVEGDAIINDTAIIAEDQITINNIDVSLKTPGDSVTYTVDLVNEGTINAEIYSIEVPSLTEEQKKYIDFKVTYDNGKEVKQGDILNKETKKNLTVKIEFKKDITESDLPKAGEEISLSYKLNFVQTDSEGVATTTSTENVQSDLFIWDGPTVIKSLSEKGIQEVKENGGHLVIPEGVTEISGTSSEEMGTTGTITTGFSPITIGKLNINNDEDAQKITDPEINIIKSVSFPSTLKKIGGFSFGYCVNLTSVNLPSNLEEIGEGAFADSAISGELIIPDRVITIGYYAFGTTQITSLKLGNNVETIGSSAFNSCKNLEGELVIPDSVITIGEQAFQFTSISSLKIGSGVREISDKAFYTCGELQGELYIPDNVLKIGDDAFSNSSGGGSNKITSISIGKNTVFTQKGTHYSFNGRPTPTIR